MTSEPRLLGEGPMRAAFAVFTFANLFPRAIAHRRWYREKFPDYPKDRTAIIPFVGK